MPAGLDIADRHIGPGEPLFVIAEIGLNHAGALADAIALVDAAAHAGASAVKLQTLVAADLVAADCPAPSHVRASSMQAFFRQFELDEPAHHAIAERVRRHGLALMATPFSFGAIDLLERVGVDAYKIASGDLTYDGLIAACARTGKPLFLSTGMATRSEIHHALSSFSGAGGHRCALLHCVSAYPVPRGSENLRAISTMASVFSVPVGLSDHGTTPSAVAIAVALGATIYERHLMLNADDAVVDHAVSSTPGELAGLVRLAADAASALGHGRMECLPAEAENRTASRRSLRAKRALPAGHVLRADDIAVVRPGTGLAPGVEHALVGVRLTRSIGRGEPFLEADVPFVRGHHAAA